MITGAEFFQMAIDNGWTTIENMLFTDMSSFVGIKITKYRTDNNLSKKEMSERLSISERILQRYESGEYDFKISQLVNICCKLEFDYRKLFISDISENPDLKYNNEKTLCECGRTKSYNSYFGRMVCRQCEG